MSDTLERGRKIAEELGLKILHSYGGEPKWEPGYGMTSIHLLLGESVEVFGGTDKDARGEFNNPFSNLNSSGIDTHKALLIAIRPIEQESDERKLLREFVAELKAPSRRRDELSPRVYKVLEMAEALLSKDAGKSPKLKR